MKQELTKKLLTKLIMEELESSSPETITQLINIVDQLAAANEKLDSLDMGIDYVAAALTGEDPEAIEFAQTSAGRAGRFSPPRGASSTASEPVKESNSISEIAEQDVDPKVLLLQQMTGVVASAEGVTDADKEKILDALNDIRGLQLEGRKGKLPSKVHAKAAKIQKEEGKSKDQAYAIAASKEERGELEENTEEWEKVQSGWREGWGLEGDPSYSHEAGKLEFEVYMPDGHRIGNYIVHLDKVANPADIEAPIRAWEEDGLTVRQIAGPKLASTNLEENVMHDNEGKMAQAQLYRIEKHTRALKNTIKDKQELEGWIQAKLTKASDYLEAARNHLEFEKVQELGRGQTWEDVIGK